MRLRRFLAARVFYRTDPPGGDQNRSGGGSGGGGGGGDEKKFVTVEDFEAFKAESNKNLNGAIKTHLKRELEPITKGISDLSAVVQKLATPPDPDDEGGDTDDKGKNKGGKGNQVPPEFERQLKAQAKELETLKKARDDAEAKAAAAEKKRSSDEEDAAFDKAADAAGYKDGVIRETVLARFRTKGWIKRDEESEKKDILIGIPDKDGDLEWHSPAKALTAYAKSDEGKRFLPPRDVGGSGGRPGKGPQELKPDSNGRVTRAQAGAVLAQIMDIDGPIGSE